MKAFLLSLLTFSFFHADAQIAGYEISTNGLDSIKIGMSRKEVEKVITTSLQPYIMPDSAIKDKNPADTLGPCKDCAGYFTGKYGTVTLLLTFFRHTMYELTDYELVGITAMPSSPLLHTKTGIKVGISEKDFITICTRNKYPYSKMPIDENNTGYLFSDKLNMHSSKSIMAKFSNKILTDLMVVNMIGD